MGYSSHATIVLQLNNAAGQTVYFFPLRLSSTVSVPRPPPGAGLMSSSEDVLLRSMEAVEISCRDRTASLVDAGLSDIRNKRAHALYLQCDKMQLKHQRQQRPTRR